MDQKMSLVDRSKNSLFDVSKKVSCCWIKESPFLMDQTSPLLKDQKRTRLLSPQKLNLSKQFKK